MKNFMGRTMAKMNDNRKKGRKALKGFTLVEIIVVLVILAILAAAMIPALTGYIEKAKNKTLVAEARNAVTAAQTLASEAYGLGKTVQSKTVTSKKTATESGYDAGYSYDAMETLAEVPGNIIEIDFDGKNKVKALKYVAADKITLVEYNLEGGFKDPVAKASGDYSTEINNTKES